MNILGKNTHNTLKDFWVKVRKTRGCWEWTGSRFSNGYGQFAYRGKNWRVHRLSFFIAFGESTGQVCHKCDNKICVNPNHLFLGNHDDNMRDMTNKQRQAYGERARSARLTNCQAVQIRKEYAADRDSRHYGFNLRTARKYGVDKQVICNLVRNRTYRLVRGG